VRAETRHQLKQDRFSKTTIDVAERTAHWSVEHRNTLTIAGIIAAVVVGLAAGGWYYLNQQDQKASLQVSQAVRTLDTPVRPPNMPPQPDAPSFGSSKERATTAREQFQSVVNNFPHTHAADVARYFVGITSEDIGDSAAAESNLKSVSSASNSGLAALAKFALASVYRNSNRDKNAVDLYKELIAKPTDTVSKTMAELALGSAYEQMNQPLEAKRIYQQVQKENPATEAAQMASAKLQELK
jgi:predicted negative regulator of RcsB-dependent stress response